MQRGIVLPKIVHFISADGLNKEGGENLAILRQHESHPCIIRHWRGLPFLRTKDIDRLDPFGTVGVPLIKFRDGLYTAFIARDEQGNWGAGPWTGARHFIAEKYFSDAKSYESFADALDDLYARRPRGLVRSVAWVSWAGSWLQHYLMRAVCLVRQLVGKAPRTNQ